MSHPHSQIMPSAGLTPVTVRGKKRPKPSSTSSASTPEPSHPKRLRPTPAPAQAQSRPHALAPLELLPPEILEQIFLQNCNIALPRASPTLSRALASASLYRKLCDQVLSSFRHTVPFPIPQSGGTLRQEWQYYSVPSGVADAEDLVKARREILSCRWLSWDVFEGHRRRALERERGRLDGVRPRHEGEVLDLWMDCRIPERLLRRAGFDGNVMFLDALVEEGCSIDAMNSFDGEVALEALYEAVRQKDYRLVHRLLARGIEVHPELDELCRALQQIKWDIAMVKLIGFCLLDRAPESDDPTRRREETRDVVMQRLLQDRAMENMQGESDRFRLKCYTHREFQGQWGGSPCTKTRNAHCDLCMLAKKLPPKWRARWHNASNTDGWSENVVQKVERFSENLVEVQRVGRFSEYDSSTDVYL